MLAVFSTMLDNWNSSAQISQWFTHRDIESEFNHFFLSTDEQEVRQHPAYQILRGYIPRRLTEKQRNYID